jgi:hypothetical protein
MVKQFIIPFLLLFLASCQAPTENCGAQKENAQCPESAPNTPGSNDNIFQPSPEDMPPSEAYIFGAQINYVNFSVSDQQKVEKAIDIIKAVISSPEFKHRVKNFTYAGKKAFVDNKGFSNEEIYQKMLDGREDLIPEVDYEMDLELELYYSSKNTVGYTYPNTTRIWMNTKYFNVFTPAEVAGNIFHEWTHKLGFDHASTYSESRDASVPYAIGYLIRDLGKLYE